MMLRIALTLIFVAEIFGKSVVINTCKFLRLFFNSPEPLGSQGELIGNPNFSNLLKRIVFYCFRRAGYSLDIMRQTACLVFNPIMVKGYAALFSCTAVVQASDSMTASM